MRSSVLKLTAQPPAAMPSRSAASPSQKATTPIDRGALNDVVRAAGAGLSLIRISAGFLRRQRVAQECGDDGVQQMR